LVRLGGLRRDDWTKVLGWPGYTVYRHEIDEKAKTLRLWVRRKRGNRRLICSGCGRRIRDPVRARISLEVVAVGESGVGSSCKCCYNFDPE
jgi:hypothetical protein